MLSVIVSTYNSPDWLEKVLWGYQCQTMKDFELILADDGSGEPTTQLIERIKPELDFPLVRVWHPDNGFQKTAILNKAIQASQADYLVFSDGDCIPRADFLQKHLAYRKPDRFLSGGYFKLPMPISETIGKEEIMSQQCFDLSWLYREGLKKSFKSNKLSSRGFKEWFLNHFTPSKATFNGHNVSAWKKDILAVNGFDERMKYGGEDRELGERMMNNGVRGKQIRYSAICIHLDHARGYVNQEDLDLNNSIRKETKLRKVKFTPFGIDRSSPS